MMGGLKKEGADIDALRSIGMVKGYFLGLVHPSARSFLAAINTVSNSPATMASRIWLRVGRRASKSSNSIAGLPFFTSRGLLP